MSIFSSARNTVITGGNFTAQSFQIHNVKDSWKKERYAIQTLKQHVAFGALYNSKERYDAPKCLPRTREAVFQEITWWIHVTSNEMPILWLYGPAGAGKSAIAQSVAEKASELGCLLLGTYFFNRSDVQRNNAARLIPSLAYQMIHSIPCTYKYVLAAMMLGSGVFSLDFKTQIERLILQPLISAGVINRWSPNTDFQPMLVIVDGLDECQSSDERCGFIRALAEIFRKSLFPVIILCHSRSESDIRATFNHSQTSDLCARLVLDNKFEADSDIRTFFYHHFEEVKQTHLLKAQIPPDWPSATIIEELVRRSSGQFIYASTVMKHVASRKHNPISRLRTILTVGSATDASPFRELDALYRLVLSCFEKDDLNTVIRMIGMICFPPKSSPLSRFYPSSTEHYPTTPALMETALSLEAGQAILLLDDLHSLIHVQGQEDPLLPFHASFGEFLQDKLRSESYYVDPDLPFADHMLAYCKTLLHAPGPTRLEVYLPMTDRLTEASLTVELREFFETFPWEHFLTKNVPNGVLPLHAEIRRDGSWLWLWRICELYNFCKEALKRSLKWATVCQRARRGLTAWVDHEMTHSSPEPFWINLASESSPDQIIKCYAHRLLGFLGNRLDPRSHVLDMVLDVVRTPGLACLHHINRKRHNSIIFSIILDALVLSSFPHTTHDLRCRMLQSSGQRKCCGRSRVDIKGLIELSDRTSYLDSLLPYIENEVCRPGWVPREGDHDSSIEELRAAISRYRQKPIPDDYDYTLKWQVNIKAVQAAVAMWLASKSLFVNLSDVLPFRLTIFDSE